MIRWEWIGHPEEGAHCQVLLTDLRIVEAEWAGDHWQRIGGGKRDDKVIKEIDIIEWRVI